MTTPQALLSTAVAMEQFRLLADAVTEPVAFKLVAHLDGRIFIHSTDDRINHVCSSDGTTTLYEAVVFLLEELKTLA